MQSWTNNLKASIVAKLDTISTTIPTYSYLTTYESLPSLYCLYHLRSGGLGSVDNTESRMKVLQIDIWYTSSNQDLTNMNNAADAIDNLFNEVNTKGSGFDYWSYQIQDNDELPTEDRNTFHRLLAYEIQYNQY